MIPRRTIVVLLAVASSLGATPTRLRCEYLDNPLGIDARAPRLSWQSDNTERNWRQSAYQIVVATTLAGLRNGKADVWDSGKQASADSIEIPYKGPALESRRRYFWTVRVWDAGGKVSEAAPSWWEMGLLEKSDWHAQWVAWKDSLDDDRAGIRWMSVAPSIVTPPPASVFRYRFELKAVPRNAALFVAATDGIKITLNGQLVATKATWRSFDRQDLTGAVTVGPNTIEITMAAPGGRRGGFVAAGSGVGVARGVPPPANSLAALLKIEDADGKVQRYPSAERWEARASTESEWKPAVLAGELGSLPLSGLPGNLPQPAALLRHEFAISKRVTSARLYVTALGSYRAYLNGKRVGNDVLTPEFTDYKKRVVYQTYDVAPLLTSGRNAIAAMLGDGWFLSGQIENGIRLAFAAPPPRLLAQLRIDYADGSHDDVISDDSWKASQSPIYHSEIYAGEVYDARREQPGWNAAGFRDSAWSPVMVAGAPPSVLAAQMTPPPRVVETLRPISIKPLGDGVFIVDMGQNLVGWAVLHVRGTAGARVRMRTGEILAPDGSLYRENLRNADATNVYVLRGGGPETYRPHFTFQGFRYLELTGYPGTPTLDSLEGEVVSSLSGAPTATISTSSELVNRFWKTGIWGQRGNFLSIPTDCPQRDERQGWTGDAEVFWRTGSFNFDIASFGRQWMRSVVDDQSADGAFGNTVPAVFDSGDGAPGWGDAGVIVPWTAWMQYGDRSIVEENWPAMQRWMEFIALNNPDYLRRKRTGANFADWLPAGSQTPKDLVATAYWALVASQMADMAHLLGKEDDARRYRDLVGKIRAAFTAEFLKPDGTVGSGSQTSYVLALYMKLAPPEAEAGLMDRLVLDIATHGGHLTTGFLGTPFLLFTLADHGRTDIAYQLLLNETYPSWGYMLSKGATTWWERWNGDSGDPAMNSYNHYAFGSVMAWVYRYAIGIDTSSEGAGYRGVVIHPHPDARLTRARGEYQSVYGKIVSDWSAPAGGPFTLKVTVPANTSARVYLPGNGAVSESGRPVAAVKEHGESVIEIGSGSYEFHVK